MRVGYNDMNDYHKTRSKFRLKIFDDNAQYITLSANKMVVILLNNKFPEIVRCGFNGWRDTQYEDTFNLKIPANCMDYEALSRMKDWAESANRHIWLGLNKNTENYFIGNEVDFCLAANWNFDKDSSNRLIHTAIGEAEYQMKYNYPRGKIDKATAHEALKLIVEGIMECVSCLPTDYKNVVVTTIPAVSQKQNKLAWNLSKHCAGRLGLPFIGATLLKDKPQMKEQSIENKIKIWRYIFDSKMIEIPEQHLVAGRDVLIIDDLYQSGASIWCYAEFLKKKYNVNSVMAVTAVKALRDGDNK